MVLNEKGLIQDVQPPNVELNSGFLLQSLAISKWAYL
jgi:hypothetical protein